MRASVFLFLFVGLLSCRGNAPEADPGCTVMGTVEADCKKLGPSCELAPSPEIPRCQGTKRTMAQEKDAAMMQRQSLCMCTCSPEFAERIRSNAKSREECGAVP